LLAQGEESESRSYLNRLVSFGAKFLEPYIDNIAVLAKGNDETSVDNKLEFSLHDGLMYHLHNLGGHHIVSGGYRGWVLFSFEHVNGGRRQTMRLYYTHGYGGGGQVTKDVIQANRKAVYLSNADIVVSGHTHDSWHFPINRVAVKTSGQEIVQRQHHVKIPSYKDEFVNQSSGWHHETGKPPKPLGAWWARFYYSKRSKCINVSFTEADT
jgi:hypothetical protein